MATWESLELDDDQLHELLTEAWRLKAPAGLRKAFDS